MIGYTKQDGTIIGNLTYAYDDAGRRIQIGGTLAQVSLPPSLSSPVYNAANQLIQSNGVSVSYDLNGNMTSDGVNAYMWNARNQLQSMSGAVSAAFQYDSSGRRTVNGAGTGFVYDGGQPVQELNGTTPTANLLLGVGTDEVLQRTDAMGSVSLLRDGLGSTVALTDSSGTIATSYTYAPFGAVSTAGSSNSNSFLFTGREAEGTGLLYLRDRYYSPQLQRFASEDILGMAGGLNSYAYVGDDPINSADPFGLETVGHHWIPKAIWEKLPDLPDEVRAFLDEFTSGQLGGRGEHKYDKLHRACSKAIQEMWEDFLKEHEISNLSELTLDEIKEFAQRVMSSTNTAIAAFTARVLAQRASFLARAGRVASALEDILSDLTSIIVMVDVRDYQPGGKLYMPCKGSCAF